MTRWCLLGTLLAVGCADPPPADPGPDPIPGLTSGTTTGTPWTAPDPGPTRPVHDRDFLPAAVAAIEASTAHLRVAQYLLYDGAPVDDLLDAIGDAAQRGVRVQVLVDEEGPETEDILARLGLRDVETAFDSRRTTLHTKLIVADDLVLVGSHNFTPSALASNHEGSLLVRDAVVAGWYATWFDRLWASPEGDPEVTPLSGAFRPVADRQVLPALLDCMDTATERIDLLMYALAWDDRYPGGEIDQLLTSIEGAHGRGVAVDVVLDGSMWIVENGINDAAVARLLGAGVPVSRTPGSVTTHAKVLRCDDEVIVGDANWSYSGIALMHGTSLRTSDPGLVDGTIGWLASVRATAR